MSVDDISDCVKSRPTQGFQKGTPFSAKGDQSRLRDESIWILDSTCEPGVELEECLTQLVMFMEERSIEFAAHSADWGIDLFCDCGSEAGQAGFGLGAQLIKRIAAFDADLLVDFIAN